MATASTAYEGCDYSPRQPPTRRRVFDPSSAEGTASRMALLSITSFAALVHQRIEVDVFSRHTHVAQHVHRLRPMMHLV